MSDSQTNPQANRSPDEIRTEVEAIVTGACFQ